MPVEIVVGAQWGDEGKGKIVDILSERFDIVGRYQGGANAGHTVEIGDAKFILHLIPSGIFHEHVTVVIGNGVVIDPVALLHEIDTLEGMGVSLKNRLKVSHNAHLIMPYHKLLDSLYEQGQQPIGTTGRGIGPAYYDKAARVGVRIVDLLDHEVLAERLRVNILEKNRILSRVYDRPELDVDEIIREYMSFDTRIDEYVTDTAHYLNNAIRDGKSVLCEGAQGALLDIDHGTYPFVTSSSPVSGGACTGLGIPPTAIDSVMGITKAYTTRVGNGPFPTEEVGLVAEHLQTVGGEFGSTTGRPRRCGWLDAVALRYSAMLNGIGTWAIMKLDVLGGLDELKVCVEYKHKGRSLKYFPSDVRTLQEVEIVYESYPGWNGDICGVRNFADLPANARAYVKALGNILGGRISCISVGPKRDQTIQMSGPMT